MATPLEALTNLLRKINRISHENRKELVDIILTNEFQIAGAVVDMNAIVGKLITAKGVSERIGHVGEVLGPDKYMCIFGSEKLELSRQQFEIMQAQSGPQDPQKREPMPLPIPLILFCPACGERHIDSHGYETKVHTTHACQNCGFVWRPAIEATVGVQFLPGFKNDF